jgi:arsenate reductase
VLFLCNGNSGRSQIGEALLGRYGEDDFEPLSAGTRPRDVHPLTVRVLAEVGIDWSAARSRQVGDLVERRFDYVITLSDSAREQCPTLRGPHSSLHWHLDDPAEVRGSEEECLEAFRATRIEISVRLRPFVELARRAAGHIPPIAGPEPRDPENERSSHAASVRRALDPPRAGRARDTRAAAPWRKGR